MICKPLKAAKEFKFVLLPKELRDYFFSKLNCIKILKIFLEKKGYLKSSGNGISFSLIL